VLLEVDVAKGAIICAPCLLEDAPALAKLEAQYIVDRRRLRNVRVMASFAPEEWEPSSPAAPAARIL
jgi:hypothetical protein